MNLKNDPGSRFWMILDDYWMILDDFGWFRMILDDSDPPFTSGFRIYIYYIVLYCIVLYYIILYCNILYYMILYIIILYFILYYIILYYIILYYIIHNQIPSYASSLKTRGGMQQTQ